MTGLPKKKKTKNLSGKGTKKRDTEVGCSPGRGENYLRKKKKKRGGKTDEGNRLKGGETEKN